MHLMNPLFRMTVCALLATLLVACAATPRHTPAAGKPAAATADAVTIPRTAPPAEQESGAARHCLALAMYWEARGEGTAGMQAVGAVVLNRVADPRFPDTACAVVKEGGERPPCQFSWWCDGKSDRPSSAAAWSAALAVADGMLSGPYRDRTNGALFFHSTAIRSPWQRQQTATIGNHVFYR